MALLLSGSPRHAQNPRLWTLLQDWYVEGESDFLSPNHSALPVFPLLSPGVGLHLLARFPKDHDDYLFPPPRVQIRWIQAGVITWFLPKPRARSRWRPCW